MMESLQRGQALSMELDLRRDGKKDILCGVGRWPTVSVVASEEAAEVREAWRKGCY